MPDSDPYEKTRASLSKAITDALAQIDATAQDGGPGEEAACRQAGWLTET